MITAREKGRSLELTVGGGDDKLVFLVPPITAAQGSAMLADWVGVAFGEIDGQAAMDATNALASLALGPVREQIEDLRWAEQEDLVNAAFMWNVQAGGIDLVNEYLAGGLPKARESLLRRAGLWERWMVTAALLNSQLLISPPSEPPEPDPTSTDGSSATTTPPGSENFTGSAFGLSAPVTEAR